MNASKVKHDYRVLLKAGYAAVKHERKNKLQMHHRIRHRFETSKCPVNDTQIKNTLAFLNTAAKRKGLEHDIVYNICTLDRYRAQYDIRPPLYNKKITPHTRHHQDTSYDELDELIELLNQELELCL